MNVSITSGDPIVQRNVKGTNITVDVGLCGVTGISVVSINSLGSSKPAVWTVLDISQPECDYMQWRSHLHCECVNNKW